MSNQDSSHPQSAVLVGIQLPNMSREELESSLLELTRLVTTLGYKVVGQVTQKRHSEKLSSVLGEGKLKELAKWTGGSGSIASMVDRVKTKAELKRESEDVSDSDETEELGVTASDGLDTETGIATDSFNADNIESADIVIVDCELSPSQLRNLESAAGVTVLDRTGVIIEIFSRHARTRAARLQVEIARLTYSAPRLRETGGSGERQGGGVGAKGSGETSLELDKRKIRDRIKELKIELGAIGNEHSVRRARRQQEISVALVGYTNAGKSSLMRAMTGSDVLVADKLFATLDTTIRPLYPESVPRILVSDTVGFIKKLPHDLVASFKSTLDEALHASLLLFVVDASDASFRSQLAVTKSVLEEVGATEVPSVLVLNKRDCLTEAQAQDLRKEFPDAILISTRNKDDLSDLRNKIISYFEEDMVEAEILVPFSAKGVIGEVRSLARILSETYNESGAAFKLRASQSTIAHIKKLLAIK